MNIKKFSQVLENFEPTHEFITEVEADVYGLPNDIEVENCKAKIYWNARFRLGKDNFSFDIWLSKVVLECVWKTLDSIEGEVINEEDKTFEYSSEEIKGTQPDDGDLQYIIKPSSFDVHLDGRYKPEVYWG